MSTCLAAIPPSSYLPYELLSSAVCCQAWSPFGTAPTPRLCAPSPMASPSCPLGARWWTAARRAHQQSSLTRPTAPQTACCLHLWPSTGWRCLWLVTSTVLPAASMRSQGRPRRRTGGQRFSLPGGERWVWSGADRHHQATYRSWTSSSWASYVCSWLPSDCCSPCCCSSSCWQSRTWTLPSWETSARHPSSSSSTLNTSALCGAGSPVSYDGWEVSSSVSEAKWKAIERLHRPPVTEMGHEQQTGQERGWEEREGEGWQPYSQYQLSFSQEGVPVTSHGPSPEEPCSSYLTITARKGNHVFLWKFRSFQSILFFRTVTVTGFNVKDKNVWLTSLVQPQITVAFIFVVI